jgi:hypothetical protein
MAYLNRLLVILIAPTNIVLLEGSPQFVGGAFSCDKTNITSLDGAPMSVGRSFRCYETQITSLKGAPKFVGGNFECGFCSRLTSLKGHPEIVRGVFNCVNHRYPQTKMEAAGEKNQVSVHQQKYLGAPKHCS